MSFFNKCPYCLRPYFPRVHSYVLLISIHSSIRFMVNGSYPPLSIVSRRYNTEFNIWLLYNTSFHVLLLPIPFPSFLSPFLSRSTASCLCGSWLIRSSFGFVVRGFFFFFFFNSSHIYSILLSSSISRPFLLALFGRTYFVWAFITKNPLRGLLSYS